MQELDNDKLVPVVKALAHIADQQNRINNIVDSLTEVVTTMLYCLENGGLTNDSFQTNLPEVQAKRMDTVLAKMFEQGVAVQHTEVELGDSVMTSGYTDGTKTTNRRSFTVSGNDNAAFLGKKVGDRVKVTEADTEEYEVLTVYAPAKQMASQQQ